MGLDGILKFKHFALKSDNQDFKVMAWIGDAVWNLMIKEYLYNCRCKMSLFKMDEYAKIMTSAEFQKKLFDLVEQITGGVLKKVRNNWKRRYKFDKEASAFEVLVAYLYFEGATGELAFLLREAVKLADLGNKCRT